MFGKLLSKIIFKVAGWKLKGNIPPDLKKAVMIAAPHTSNWDFVYSRAAFYLMDIPVRMTIKKEAFFFPIGNLISSMGAIPVDRKKNNNLVSFMVDLFKDHEQMIMMVTPEGTRKYQPRWKKGFYHAAMGAGVPIVLGFLDYAKKEAGIGPIIYPTGDYEADLEKIKAFYRTVTPKYPAQGVR
ncbi:MULTISPECIES: lysophospholipid acyltransferase family protein [Rufibacter]|uniref:1-acyl-sn-glycerol-3-phosphate acyltransferase n=1 Tax=Rufibacter quisquiliarum TaxID=1549639 RepID=A0A839GKX4_9BACT|nr:MULTISPECIES: lysophospholipid acyltransferase family protein [Rufibacter]MBA9077459.1 1-acyl-sn-glycerol-3-phosphate acyltransferase [Rufibacter quisquiliarum]